MKIWKLAGCLGLLVVIICGCIVLGQSAEAAAKTPEDNNVLQNETPKEEQNEEKTEEETQPQTPPESSTTVEKTYSTGLFFRSNGDGSCAVAGLGTCTAACVLIPPKSPLGDTVVEILPGAFRNSTVGAIELPSGLTTLSAASFEGCTRLSYIRVSEGNTAFSEHDGALYTADGRTLLYCPAGRTAKDLHLHEGLRRIVAGAFAECHTLSTVYFCGTTAEWHALIVGDDNNALYQASLKFVK